MWGFAKIAGVQAEGYKFHLLFHFSTLSV